ncbi:hypothetical protein LSH36_780g02063 [Paralvinella palmiformis]|uniref:Uncharacterized protein n=1 Tax=Paralvinella palmiformis TaxID=53620 RepID=A0AAD9J092_9ANNE|nr:hypothetical protein LSH36_780g02063 [Paralvinella palmiformis]
MDDKRAFLMEKCMCFGCYGSNHISKGCMKKRTCIKCGKRHPSAMHIEDFIMTRDNDDSTPNTHSKSNVDLPYNMCNVQSSSCHTTDSTDTVVLHVILPVTVHHKGSYKVVTTYAFYDNGSSGCFMTEKLKDQLKASGTETLLQLRTMHGQNYVNTIAIENLIVSDLKNKNAIDLPKTLGESCSHLAALWFKVEAAVRLGYTRRGCTELPCCWNNDFVKKVKPAPVHCIQFYKKSANKKLCQQSKQNRYGAPSGLSLFKEQYQPFCWKITAELESLPQQLTSLYMQEYASMIFTELNSEVEEILMLRLNMLRKAQ